MPPGVPLATQRRALNKTMVDRSRRYTGTMRAVCHALIACLLSISLGSAAAPADDACAACHPSQVEQYSQTGMGRSITRSFDQPAGEFQHDYSGTSFKIAHSPEGMIQTVERNGFTASARVDFVIGSGNAAFGYLVRQGPYLFQSPFSYYTKRAVWDVAPGYEENSNPEFERPVTAECLWCHAGEPLPVAQTFNQYEEPVFRRPAISCDRCHGGVEAHLKNPSAATIVNPARLPPVERDSVCEQCHLGGEARIANPGKSFGDFRPGMKLEEVFSVYLREEDTGAFKVVSHVEQLAASRCRQESGDKMWCGTCHNPHENPANAAAYYRDRCQTCHEEASLASHPQPRENCIGCHMPRKQAYDSGHSAFTDHRIARRPQTQDDKSEPQLLRAWRTPAGALEQRNLGLAYFRIGEKNRSPFHAEHAFRNLLPVMGEFPNDPELPSALGRLILLRDRPQLTLELLQHVVTLEPKNAIRYQGLAEAHNAMGDRPKAIEALRKAISLDPMIESSYSILARLYLESQQPELALKTWDEYLQLRPQSIFARGAKRRIQSRISSQTNP